MATDDIDMSVTKRNGNIEPVSFDKILNRIKKIGQEVSIKINYTSLAMKVIDQIYDKINTTKIDEISAEQCASMASIHPDYNILAGRIIISNHQRNTSNSFSDVMTQLYYFKDKHEQHSPLISKQLFEFVTENKEKIDAVCDYSRDYLIDYFGFKTLERAYLMKVNKVSIERIQHMWLRVSIGIHGNDFKRIVETYELMSNKYFIHATPTLFNSGTPHPQLSSCYLQALESDSIEGIYNTIKECAMISKWAGGIGVHIHNVRATGSHIRGTNGSSNGIVPMLKVFNNTAKYVDQCLDPNTLVYTKRGPIPIRNIIVGDKVVTDDGNFYEIGKVLDNDYNGDMYELCVENILYPLKCTSMHPLWVVKNDLNNPNEVIIEQLKRNLLVPEFIEVKNIEKNDFVGYSIPLFEKDIVQYSEDDCRMYGIMVSNGVINNNYASIILQVTKTETIEFIKQYLQKINIIMFTKLNQDNISIKLSWTRNNMFKFTYEMLYNQVIQVKKIIPNILHLPKNKLLHFLKGFIETTGKIREDSILLDIDSMEVVDSLKYIGLRLRFIMTEISSGYNNIISIPKTQLISDFLNSSVFDSRVSRLSSVCDSTSPTNSFVENSSSSTPLRLQTFFEYNNFLFSKVKKNTLEQNYSGRVIDIEVNHPDHHNFLTVNGLVKNGGGKRSGSFAIYLEPWHADVELFLQMRKNHGDEELKARDLFYAIWMPDLFMNRVKAGGTWTLMCPDECPGLSDVYGEEFVNLYESYEKSGKGRKTMNARDLWFQILDSQMETGTPYIVYKDSANKKSNQKNLGTIKSSNLCSEIIQYSDSNETAVCNLASIGLPSFLDKTHSSSTPEFRVSVPSATPLRLQTLSSPASSSGFSASASSYFFNYEKLHEITKVITYNLNKVIDINFYPTKKTRTSNMKHRPIGIGVQGLADVFMILNIPFTSPEAREINRKIFETIYHAALEESCELAIQHGFYESFPGSPTSNGILQFDMWNVNPTNERYDWDELKKKIKIHGLRNSLLLAPMPTASTSQILGFNECIEPITSNIYSRRTLAGEFIMANKYLMNDLLHLDLWNEKIKNNIIANNGSIQQLEIIPIEIREKYKTVWELPMKTIIDYSADRGAYICQSQSLNLWLEDPNYNTLTSMHFYGWSKGLKTGIYYLRRRGAHKAQQFTIEVENKNNSNNQIEEDEICESCSA